MQLRSFRTILLSACLLVPLLLSGALAVRAATPSTHAGRSFKPGGHGVVKPQEIDTANLPQMNVPQLVAQRADVTSTRQPVSSRRASVPLPSNVVSVPAASSTTPAARVGMSEQKGEGNPDAMGAGGTVNYLETVNVGLTVYGRGGLNS